MEENLYLKNYNFLMEKYKWIIDDLEEYKSENLERQYTVCNYQTYENTNGLYLQLEDEKILQFGSQYCPSEYAKKWVQYQFEKNNIEYNSVIFVFGIGSGEYIKEIKNQISDDNIVIVFEPEIEVLDSIMNYVDLGDIVSKHMFIVSDGKECKKLFEYLMHLNIHYSNLSLVKYIDLPNYRNMFKEGYNEYKKTIKGFVTNISMNANTMRVFEHSIPINNISALYSFLKSNSLKELIDKLPCDKPAIIISAGPSLNNNIEKLKKAKNKFFLVATDTALKPLLKHDIIPDIYVTVDADKPMILFEDERVKNIPVLAMFDSRDKVILNCESALFYDYGAKILQKILKVIQKDKGYRGMVQGGSVAHLAFTFVLQAKMNPIIFVGQDLAFPGNKTHVDGAFSDNTVLDDTHGYMYVDDIYGNPVLTRYDMKHYKDWFEEQIPYYVENGVKFIDATEGGAKIEGTEIMTLEKVISKYGIEEIDYENLVKNIPLFLQGEVKQNYLELIYNIPNELEEIIEKTNSLVCQYEKINEITNKSVLKRNELENILDVIKECNEFLDEKAVITPIIESYNAFASNQAALNVEKTYSDVKEDLKDIARRGIIKAKSMMESAQELKPVLLDIVKKIEKEYR